MNFPLCSGARVLNCETAVTVACALLCVLPPIPLWYILTVDRVISTENSGQGMGLVVFSKIFMSSVRVCVCVCVNACVVRVSQFLRFYVRIRTYSM